MMAPANARPKQRNRLLAALDLDDLAALAPHLKEASFRLGDLLQEAGDPIEQIYFPQSGMISLLAVMESGAAVETATIGPEGAVGVLAGLLGGGHAVGRAVVQLEGLFLQIAAPLFQDAVAKRPGIRDLVRRYSDAQMTLVYQVAGCNALHPAVARLSRWILQTRDRSEGDIFPMTQEFLSEMLGVQRTTVTTVARELQDHGLIAYRRGKIEILDRPGLERKACECYAAGRRAIDKVFRDIGRPTN
jgi:CRP-like cAMP-binding protein